MIRADRYSTPWGQIIMKIVQIICLFLAAVLAGSWSSKDTDFTDLNVQDNNQRPFFEYLIIMAAFGIVWPIVSIVILFPFKQDLPPIAVLVVNLLLTVLLVIAAALFIGAVVSLSESTFARTVGLNLTQLEAACFFAIISAVAYVGDVLLEVIASIFTVRALGPDKLILGSCCS